MAKTKTKTKSQEQINIDDIYAAASKKLEKKSKAKVHSVQVSDLNVIRRLAKWMDAKRKVLSATAVMECEGEEIRTLAFRELVDHCKSKKEPVKSVTLQPPADIVRFENGTEIKIIEGSAVMASQSNRFSSIDDDAYSEIKEFCDNNEINIDDFITKNLCISFKELSDKERDSLVKKIVEAIGADKFIQSFSVHNEYKVTTEFFNGIMTGNEEATSLYKTFGPSSDQKIIKMNAMSLELVSSKID